MAGPSAAVKVPLQDIGGIINAASVPDPRGNRLGLIDKPRFSAAN